MKHRWPIIIAWVALAVTLRISAPKWTDVAADGDFDYLPAESSSVAGGRIIEQAFPGVRPQSQVVLVLARNGGPFLPSDEIVALDLQRCLHHQLAQVATRRFMATDLPNDELAALISESYDRSIAADDEFYELVAQRLPDEGVEASAYFPRMAIAFWDRGHWQEYIGGDEQAIGEDFDAALTLYEDLPSQVAPIEDRELRGWNSLLDILSWDDSVIGGKMKTDASRLAVLRLSSELAATENIATVEAMLELIETIESTTGKMTPPGLELKMTGSAAIGGETLMAARDAIRYTESITVAMILLILVLVYRAPILIFVPVLSIGVAVVAATSLVALLADGSWVKIFTTSRIFIVVILFGAGTDYCLFLISRLREECSHRSWLVACAESLSGVSAALVGSAMTTVIGLAMLGFAEFGKFQYTGPVIAICLTIGLLVSLTLTPALLSVVGPKVFWPSEATRNPSAKLLLIGSSDASAVGSPLWSWIALMLTRRPAVWLVGGIIVLAIPGWYGWQNESSVTYDISSELNTSADSRQGLRLLREHYKIGEVNPVTVLLVRNHPKPRKETDLDIRELSTRLYQVDDVISVRTADDPLGDFPPDRKRALFSKDDLTRLMLREHRTAQNYFFSTTDPFVDRLVRIDVPIEGDPFNINTASTVENLKQQLGSWLNDPDSGFADSQLYVTGTTASLIDLRSVITRDNRRIKIAVVLAVFVVLVLVIRRIGWCVYLIATVLLSYYATLGMTVRFFRWAYGDDYVGLDWKLPVFLFVILVAIGQDYNVYLVTRILEEEKRLGWIAALRRAVAKTGGIITACGLVMAATFFSMTASAWLPPVIEVFTAEPSNTRTLRGIVELGFALGLGMIVDTFYVRTILVPSFVAVLGRFQAQKPR